MVFIRKNAKELMNCVSFFLRNFVLSVLFLLNISNDAFAGSWNVIWQEDFGVVEDSVCRDFADPDMTVPGHKLADVHHLQDGYYGIANNTYWSFIHKKSVNKSEAYHFVPGRDHTGNENGGMLIVNVGGDGLGESIYEKQLRLNICGDHKYRLSMFVANVSDASLSPNLTLQVYNYKDAVNPELLGSVNVSGDEIARWPKSEKNSFGLYLNKVREWTETTVEFEAKKGDDLKIVIVNNCSSGNGNDFALDDIILQRYDDEEVIQPEIGFDVALTKEMCIPTYSINNQTLLDSWKKIYDNVFFLWQVSFDDGYTWTSIPEESGIEKMSLRRPSSTNDDEVYRVVITGGTTEAEAKSKAEEIAEKGTLEDGCDYFSISNIIYQTEAKHTPAAYLGIDGDMAVTNQPAYECSKDIHYVSLSSEEWDARYSSYSIRWQYSYNQKYWTDLDFTDNHFEFSNEFKGLTYFRVILASDEESLNQVIKNGKPDDCNADYLITNIVSIECACEIPEFEAVVDSKSICQDSDASVDWKVKQTNQSEITSIEWYSKAEKDSEWTLISGETEENISVANPKISTTYLFLAKSGDCVSDSVFFNLEVAPAIVLASDLNDVKICEDESVDFDIILIQGSPTDMICNGKSQPYYDFDLRSINRDTTFVLYATDNICKSEEMTLKVEIEKLPDFSLSEIPSVICENERVKLNVYDDNFTSDYTFQWEKDGVLLNETGLSISFYADNDATYKFIAKGNACHQVEKEVSFKVEKRADFFIYMNTPRSICEGDSVSFSTSLRTTPVNTFKWERNGELLTDSDPELRDFPTETINTYKFSIFGDVCPALSQEFTVDIVSAMVAELRPVPPSICEGERVDLSVDVKNGEGKDIMVRWEKNGEYVNNTDLSFSDLPNEDVTYRFLLSDGKCYLYEKNVSVSVEKKIADFELSISSSTICEGESVTVSSDIQLSSFNTVQWSKDDSFSNSTGLIITDIPDDDATYTLIVKGENCPAVEKKISVKVEKKAEVEVAQIPDLVCEGENINLIANAQLYPTNTFKWEKNGTVINEKDLSTSDIADGDATYKFSVLSDKCPAIEKELNVAVEKKPELTLSINKTIACENESVELTISGIQQISVTCFIKKEDDTKYNDFYGIIGGSPTESFNLSVDKSASVKVIATDLQVCKDIESNEVSLTIKSPIDVTFDSIPDLVCEGSDISLNATLDIDKDVSYGWIKNGDNGFGKNKTSINDTPAGLSTYEFWASNSVCPDYSRMFEVEVEPTQILELSASDVVVCEDESVTLSTDYHYAQGILWERKEAEETQFVTVESGNSEFTASPNENTTYRVSAISEHGCPEISAEKEIVVNHHAGLTLYDVSACEGESVNLEFASENPYDSLTWLMPSGEYDIVKEIKIDSSFSYSVKAYSGKCVEERYATVNVVSIPHIKSHEKVGDKMYQMIVDDTDEALYFDFHNGEGKTSSDLLRNTILGGRYTVDVSNEQGCASSYKFTVPFIEPIFPKYFLQGEENWVIGNLDQYSHSTLRIFDRFGKLLFSADAAVDGWDGSYNGYDLPSTDYWYELDIPEIDKQYAGHFTLMRR